MTDKRTVTVSVTINLGNYENLRLEVSDTAETKEEADALRNYLASILDGYGNNNAAARAAIQKYKEHILADGGYEPALPSAEADDCAVYLRESEPEAASSKPDEDVSEVLEDVPAVSAEPVLVVPEADSVHVLPEPSLPPAPVVDEENTQEFVCSKCGAPVSKVQRDVSMLFNNKILCKNCMK